MAGSSKKASSKSLKRTRQAAASDTQSASKSPKSTRQTVASDTQSASQSPKKTQQSKADASETESGDFNNEDYNIRSPERTRLLTKIKGIINNAPVSPALWACCQLADMKCLQDVAKTPRWMILGYQDSLAFIALQCKLLGF
jgi:hypothetical protein